MKIQSIELKIKTLVELYNFSSVFRISFSRLCKSHNYMLSHINFKGESLHINCIDNDLEVYRCFGVLQVFYELGYIGFIEFEHFFDVIARFQSYHFVGHFARL